MAGRPRRLSVRYLLLLRDALRAGGVDTARILELAGLAPAWFERRDTMLTSAQADAFIAAAARVTGRNDLGFVLGRLVKLNSHDLLGYGLISCPDVDALLRMASRHFHLITDIWSLRYSRRARIGELLYTPMVALPPRSMRFYLEALSVSLQNQLRMLLGPELPGYDYYLSMPPPSRCESYLAFLPARFHFVDTPVPVVRVRLPAALLDAPLALSDVNVMREIDERCAAIGTMPAAGGTGWGEYVAMMLRDARGGLVTLEQIAAKAGVSSKTVARHLGKEGLNFRSMCDQVRFERARDLLRVPGASVSGVALQLGFSDTPNFSRSFRRVVGVAPGSYQRQVLG